MKRKVSIIMAVIFLLMITAAFLSPVKGNAFWYGDEIPKFIYDNDLSLDELHDYLVEEVLPKMGLNSFGTPPPTEGRPLLYDNENNPDGDLGVTIYNRKKCWNGYTVFFSIGGHQPNPPDGPTYHAILVDMNGDLVREWDFGRGMVKMLPGGYVLGNSSRRAGRNISQQDWWGEEEVLLYGGRWHHDYEVEGSPVGYYAPSLEPQPYPEKMLILSGMSIDNFDISQFRLVDDVIYEIDDSGEILFEWHANEHFEPNTYPLYSDTDLGMGFDDEAKWAIYNVKALAPPSPGPPRTDWTHANCVSYLGPNKWYNDGKGYDHKGHYKKGRYKKGYGKGKRDLRFHPDNIIFDFRANNILAIIARYDHPDGDWLSGDIVWRVGPHYSPGYEEHKLGQIIGPHMTHMIPMGLPGAGNILVFDNGGDAGYGSFLPGMQGHYPCTFRDYSRVIEFNPITLEIVWEYKKTKTIDANEDGVITAAERKFYSPYISGAQRLKNGNTLITEGRNGRLFEVTRNKKIVWEYISPYEGFVPIPGTGNNGVHRAYRVPYDWVPQGWVSK